MRSWRALRIPIALAIAPSRQGVKLKVNIRVDNLKHFFSTTQVRKVKCPDVLLQSESPPPYFHVTTVFPRLREAAFKPLRILFCGSDEFSSASLHALCAERQRNPGLIKSIDVVCRPGKLTGRAMNTIREVPLKAVAQNLGLPIHEIDTFTHWELPKPDGESINLVITVSFGLLVPARILNAVEFGGLNLHPSILPQLRGPSPLHQAILDGFQYTGVSLQTMHPNKFDHGVLLHVSKFPIPNWETCTIAELLDYVAPKAAELLVDGLREKVFVPPLNPISPAWLPASSDTNKYLIVAPKITPSRKEIQTPITAVKEFRRYRAFGRLWSNVFINDKETKRIIFEDFTFLPTYLLPGTPTDSSTVPESQPLAEENEVEQAFPGASFFVSLCTPLEGKLSGKRIVSAQPYYEDGEAIILPGEVLERPFQPLVGPQTYKALRIEFITVEGEHKKPASRAIKRFARDGTQLHFRAGGEDDTCD